MRLLQLNIWQGRLMKNFVQLVSEINPDIITLQELCSSGDIESMFFNNLEVINAELDYPYQIYSPTLSFHMMQYDVKFGNAIFSKIPFNINHTVFTNLEYKADFDPRNDDYNIRNFIHAEITIGGKNLHILTHHGQHIKGSKDGNQNTKKQMQVIQDYIDKLSGAVILTGDFNLNPQSESLQLLNNSLNNLCILNNIESTRNEFSTTLVQVCDYIFTNNEVQTQKFEVIEKIVSDHQALLLDFDVK